MRSWNLTFDVLEDFTPLTQLAGSHGLTLVPSLPVNSVAELVDLGKKKELSYATNGVGNITHVAGFLFEARARIKMLAVPYNTPNLTTDVMTGTMDLTFYSIAAAAPLVKSGELKALAVTVRDVPRSFRTRQRCRNSGTQDYDVTGWFGLLFPANTPRTTITKTGSWTNSALRLSSS